LVETYLTVNIPHEGEDGWTLVTWRRLAGLAIAFASQKETREEVDILICDG